jgi:hypothetical protein
MRGAGFIRELRALSFGDAIADRLVFVDEFELPARHDAEKGGAPDYAVITDDCLWLIELKTERGSHRDGQISSYFDLARHHHPNHRIDLTYLTPTLSYEFTPPTGHRYSHLFWEDVVPLIRTAWADPLDHSEAEVVDGLCKILEALDTPWDRTAFSGAAAPQRQLARLQQARALAAETASDGRQRALDFAPADLEELLQLRVEVRNAIAEAPEDSPIRHVGPWIWRVASGGRPMTDAGKERGMELRLSRYATPRS